MARKTGQIIRRGSSIWLVRIYIGRDPDTRKRVYIAKSIHGGLRDAQAHLNRMLAERDLGRNIRSSRQTLGQYLEHWLDISARPRLRPKSYRDYSSLLTRYICPRLGARPLGELSAAEIQTLYSELLDRGLSARTIRYIAPLPRYLSDRHGPDDRTEFIGATHRPLSVELQANAGILSRLTGVPSVERFFGGNRASTPFIPGEPWSVRDQPYIRSIPENEPGSAITNANIGGARYIPQTYPLLRYCGVVRWCLALLVTRISLKTWTAHSQAAKENYQTTILTAIQRYPGLDRMLVSLPQN